MPRPLFSNINKRWGDEQKCVFCLKLPSIYMGAVMGVSGSRRKCNLYNVCFPKGKCTYASESLRRGFADAMPKMKQSLNLESLLDG